MTLRSLQRSVDVLSPAEAGAVSRVDRAFRIPLYLQVKRELQRMIAQWDGPTGRFFTDDALCQRFKVSRVTVRQAVAELVDEGALTRTAGLGTFITRAKLEERALVDSFARPAFGGEPAEIDITAFVRLPCPASVAEQLGVAPGTQVRYVRRVRRHRGAPVRLDHRYLPLWTCRGLTRRETVQRSLVDFLSTRFTLARADLQMEAKAAGPEDAATLHIIVGDPLLVRHLVYRDAAERPLMAGQSLYRSDLMRYAVSIPYDAKSKGRARRGNSN